MLGTSNFIQEDWHGRRKGEERSLRLMRIPKSYQLSVGTREGLCYRFFGFCEQVIFSQLVYLKDLLSIANLKTC